MKLKTLLIVLSIFLFASCSENEDSGDVNIRLSNASEVVFENATFDGVNFGTINPNETSEYRHFEVAYDYGRVQITINGFEYGWTPIDYVGETPLEGGNYTFEFNFDTSTLELTDRFIRD